MDLLTEPQISEELATIPGWTRDGTAIIYTHKQPDACACPDTRGGIFVTH